MHTFIARLSGRRYDALARQIGRGPEEAVARRRFIVIQIDGLAYEYLVQAMAQGQVPTLQKLVAQGWRLQRWRCGVPSSTPAVQAGLLYGNNWDIPAFRWYEKDLGAGLMCKVPAHVERIKARAANGRPGILAGGSSYTNLLDGDARLALFTLSAMGRDRFFDQLRGLGWALLFILNPWRTVRIGSLTLWELLRDVARTLVLWARSRFRRRLTLVRPVLQVLANVVFGEVQTFGVLLDLYRGVPAIYTTYYGYDEVAHGDGPLGHEALRALRRIDGHIRRIDRARRLYRPDTDLYIFSDHGLTPSIPFGQAFGCSLGEFVARQIGNTVSWDEAHGAPYRFRQQADFMLDELAGIEPHLSRRGQRLVQALRRWIQDRTPPDPESPWDLARSSDVVVRASGSLAHLYFNVTRERMEVSEIAILYPDLLAALAGHPGIGLVLGLENGHPVVVTPHGAATMAADRLPAGLPEPAQTAADLARLVSFPHSGDLVLLGAWDGQGRVITFEDQTATHGGIFGPQDYPFFLTPPGVPLDLSGVTNAGQLYAYFKERYQD